MTEKYMAPAGEVEWFVKPNGKYYDHEVGDWLPEEVALRRVRGCTVRAQTDFLARKLGSTQLMLAPEHVEVTECVLTRIVDVNPVVPPRKLIFRGEDSIRPRKQSKPTQRTQSRRKK